MDRDLQLKPKETVPEKLSFQRYVRLLWFRIPKVVAVHLKHLGHIRVLHQQKELRNAQVNMHRV
jgi:hypothetical protein